jgi:hypothetical protein
METMKKSTEMTPKETKIGGMRMVIQGDSPRARKIEELRKEECLS